MPPMTSVKTSGANGSLHPAPASCPRSTRSNRPWTPPMLEVLAFKVMGSPAGCARDEEHRRTSVQRHVGIASEQLVDDEAVAIEWPAGAGIEHTTGQGRAALHEVSGEVCQCRAVRGKGARADEETGHAEKLDRYGG